MMQVDSRNLCRLYIVYLGLKVFAGLTVSFLPEDKLQKNNSKVCLIGYAMGDKFCVGIDRLSVYTVLR